MLKKLFAAVMVAFPFVASAGAIGVQPTVAYLPAEKNFASITFTNNLGREASFEVSVVEEEGVGAEVKQIPSSDIVVSPPIFTMPADGSQILRYAIKVPRNKDTEKRYRIIAAQLPDNSAPENGLKLLFKLSMAIFLAPTEPAPALSKTLEGDKVRVTNTGNMTLAVQSLKAADCPLVNFNKTLRPTQSWAAPVADVKPECAYRATTNAGVVPLKD